MKHNEKDYTIKEALLFSQRVAQLSKALWKTIEKDWQQWIKPYDLNINEHHILWIADHLNGASISEIAKFGVMHVSTAFNFSKKLEERGYLEFSKKANDKRNTYIKLTKQGEEVLEQLLEDFSPDRNSVFKGALPLQNLYGKFPEMLDMMCIIRNIYGDDFMEIFERSFDNLEDSFYEENGSLTKKAPTKETSEQLLPSS
ncbi:HTH-type transcriptional regulator Hpr [Metabacillus niabensis]|uniref:HTH-type transcriptional regulator Hpr n=1 Tax=Metabacillus niabensis TaxID=324854 RepID=A0ABT9YW91_9BACI|nr:HTH-type transcriptional regulator Hpr [Metabacillus niabensis]MDQ0224263.1 MarR family protease production transcriptional regulator HPr [Metabacillus niabensis]PAD68393.1 transcriptional regulator Hpr [Bacillus sp. 7586-K]